MTWFRCGGIPVTLKNAMNAVLNKKFGTSTTYDPSGWPDDVNLMGPLPVKSASGAIASFADGADGVPVKSCSVSFTPSGGGGTPSAPVAISGVSGLSVTKLGKNLLLPHNADIAETTLNGIKRSYSLDNQEFTFDGTNTKTDAGWLIYAINTSDFVLNGLKSEVTYRFSHNLTADFYAQITYNKSGGGVGAMGYLRGNAGRNASVSFTLPSDFSRLRQFQIGVVNTATDVNITAHFQIEVGSTATTYSAYVTPSVVTDTFGQTIYGGERDLTTDKASVTSSGKIKFNDDSLTWTYQSSYSRFICTSLSSVIKKPASNTTVLDGLIASCYVSGVASTGSASPLSIACDNTGGLIVYDSNYTDVTTWLNNIGNEEFVYPLATPTEITGLTPHAIDTLYGDNNIYADTGTTTVEYRADIDLALNALQGSRSLSASLMRSESPEEVSEPEENIQNTEEQEGENDER